MKKHGVASVVAAIVATAVGAWMFHTHRRANPVSIFRSVPARAVGNSKWIVSKLGQLPLSFEENRGQFDPRVKFLSRGAGYGLFISSGQATIVHQGTTHITDGGDASSPIAALGNSDVRIKSVTQLTWLGASPNAQPRAAGRNAGESNYLIGKDSRKWQRHVQHHDRVRLAGLYPGIDLIYHGVQQQVEMDYIIAPHADPKAIQIGISGPSLVSVDSSGQLSISSAGDEMLLLPPVAYQEKDGHRETVEARYVLAESHQVGFEVGAYDRSRPLIIDPVLTFAAAFGANSNSSIVTDVALDPTGNVYLTGTTCDTNYPTTFGAFQTGGGSTTAILCNDAIVTKLNPTATELLYSTYIGGNAAADFATRILVDGAGEATVAGNTGSTDFPTTSGSYQTSLKSGTCDYSLFLKSKPCTDAFLLKLSADGSSLVYSTLFGGERIEMIVGLTQDSSGNSYIAGATNSILLPVTNSSTYGGTGTCQGAQVPCFDGFIAKIKSDGSQLLASTYLGGNDDDFIAAVDLDTSGNVYVTGTADSTNFPTTTGAYQTTHAGAIHFGDAFLSEFDSNLQTLKYSTFFGGSAEDIGSHLRVDSSGSSPVAYLIGSSLSPDLPTTTGAYQMTYKGAPTGQTICIDGLDTSILDQPTCGDTFLAKIDPSKTGTAQLVFSTYLGGSGNDFAYDFVLDSQKNAWLIGNTNSPDFPVTVDAYFSDSAISNLFLSEIKNDGTQLLFSTFLSHMPSSGQLGLGITIDSSDNVYVAGQGMVSPTPGTYTSGTDLFVMKFAPGTAQPSVLLSATNMAFPTLTTPVGSTSEPISVTLTNNGTATLHLTVGLEQAAGLGPVPFSEYDNCGNTLAASATCTINAIYEPVTATGNFDSGQIEILSDAPGAPHTITLSGLTGTLDSASLVPPALTFNGQAPGTVSAPQTAGINNPATALSLLPITTGLPVVTGPNASEFVVNAGAPSNCPVATHQCFLSITFNPAAGDVTGTRTAAVSIPTNAANSPQTLSLTGNVSTGPFALFSLAPVTPTQVGQTLNTTVFLQNTGGSSLTVTGVAAGTGTGQGDFVLSNESGCAGYPNFTVASQGVCLLNLAFTPAAHGTRSATFTLVDNETSPAVLTLTGYGKDPTGPAFSLSLFPTPVNGQLLFPDTVVNQNSGLVTATVTILNEGNASGQVTSFTLPGTDFTQTNTCQAAIPASGSCAFTVMFAPTAAGLRTETLSIVTNSPGGQTFTVNFSGNGVQIPVATVTPPNISFGTQVVGTTTVTAQAATIANSGNGVLNFSNVTLTGPFTDTTTCGATLAANTSCMYSFKFVPIVVGNAGGTLTISTNGAGNSIAIGLNGTGVTGPVAKAVPASLSFGSQPINSISASMPVTFTNVGDTAFTIAGARASENFSETNNCPSSLGPGLGCTINVSFVPTNDVLLGGNAQTSGDIFVTMSAPGSPFAIPVDGIAIPSTGAASNLSITSSVNPSLLGQSVTFTATVTPVSGTGTPTGTVTIFDSATQLGSPVPLSAEKAMLATSALGQGNHSIFFRYSGDATFAPETSSGIVQSVKANTTTTIASSANPSTVGQSVTFTATVTSPGVAPTGIVTFEDGANSLGTGTLNGSGMATFITSSLTAAAHSITAVYAGDVNSNGSTSAVLTQTVNTASKASTSTSVATSLTPSSPGASVTFTATVTTASGTPTGTVTFMDGTTSLGTGTLAAGKATLSTTTLASGSHSITAVYGGDTNFNGSTSNAITQVVLKSTTTIISSSINPSVTGQSVTFSATVAGASGMPTGTVTFLDGVNSLGTGALNGSGVATFATSSLAAAAHSITASYGGDANFASSTSPVVTQTVGSASIALVSAPPPVTAGQSDSINLIAYASAGSTLAFNLSCVGAPVKTSCSFSSNPVTPALAGTPVTLTFGTSSSILPHLPSNRSPGPLGTLGFSAALAALMAAGMIQSRHAPKRRLAFGMCLAVVTLAAVLAGCAGDNSGGSAYTGTPKGTATFTVMGTSTTGNPATTISTQVSVTVQ